MPTIQIPPPTTPFFQVSPNGMLKNILTRDWYRYFIELNNLLGGGSTTTNVLNPEALYSSIQTIEEEDSTSPAFGFISSPDSFTEEQAYNFFAPIVEQEQTPEGALPFLVFNMLNEYIDCGVYTPTLSNVTNLDASTASPSNWLRVGDSVLVSGQCDVDPTATATLTKLGISLPIAAILANAYDLGGVAGSLALSGQCAGIQADTANNRASMEWLATDTTNKTMTYSFQYKLI